MTKSTQISCLFVVLLSSCTLYQKPAVVTDGESVAGLSLEQYSITWWQWTYSMPREQSPVRDRTGEFCHVNQQGQVWFLAGGFGSSMISRSCSIPKGKFIFFPVINMISTQGAGGQVTCDAVKRSAALNNDHLIEIAIEIDGQMLPPTTAYRLKSPQCFDLAGMIPKEQNAPSVYPAASDGYWIMLRPLKKGEHSIKFHAQYTRPGGAFGQMAQNISYSLDVR